ncbi:hypothetical protein DFH11DRAFT_1615895 [Phellopilus nigrolimitatus]|nr:hypothetical protein DFH11DRAFT_1615895 [Phellopilus nigrolimitatus]
MSIGGRLEDAKTLLVVVVAYLAGSIFLRPILGGDLLYIVSGVPLIGALVRFRVNCTPINTPTDEESGGLASEDRKARNYLHLLTSVLKAEGWSGLYKGTVPPLAVWLFTKILCGAIVPYHRCHSSSFWLAPILHVVPELFRFTGYTEIATVLITLPFNSAFLVLTNRTITTPHKLAFRTHPVQALRSLLSTSELANPLSVLASPQIHGVAFAQLLFALYIALVWRPLRALLDASPQVDVRYLDLPSALIIARYFALSSGLLALSVFLLTPLEVVSARLSVVCPAQAQAEDAEGEKDSRAVAEVEIGRESSSPQIAIFKDATENVEDDVAEQTAMQPPQIITSSDETRSSAQAFRLRHEPYTGLLPCIREILAEEGRCALWRGWWVTACVLL